MKRTYIITFLAFCFYLPILFAQEKTNLKSDKCFTDFYNTQLLSKNPNMMGGNIFRVQLNKQLNKAKTYTSKKAVITIPLVIHILHNGEAIGEGANISNAQVLSQVTVLNEDFRMMMGTPGQSTRGGVDVEVEFVMAKRTPNGCATNGINRINICQDGTNSTDVNFWKAQVFWDATNYMNMYSSKYIGDLDGSLGFAQFPGGPAATDGVSSGHTFFGSSDYNDGTFNLSPPYDKGRTMTHEVGHFLGLFHTFFNGCSETGDNVIDTPPIAAPNYGCPTGIDSCTDDGVDMIENYMDYTDDTCMNTFTQGQKDRIQAVLASSENRATLGESNGATALANVSNDVEVSIECLSVVENCDPQINANVKIINWGTSTLTNTSITYNLDDGVTTNYNWSGSLNYGEYDTFSLPTIIPNGGTETLNITIAGVNNITDSRLCNNFASKQFSSINNFAAARSVNLTLITDNFCEETTWEFKDENGRVLFSGGPYEQDVQDNIMFNESFPVDPEQCYLFTINDSEGDGICCAFGNGAYDLKTDDGTLIFSGGSFKGIEDTNITIGLNEEEVAVGYTISLFPNPTLQVLNINVSNNSLPDSYVIYNTLGQRVVSKTVNIKSDIVINTSSYNNGVYFIKIQKDNNSVSIPFVKQ